MLLSGSMKQKILVIIGFLVVIFLTVFIVRMVSGRSGKQGDLRVESNPAASVFLDNKHIGRTPIGKTSFKADEGEHVLKIVPESTVTQLSSWQGKIKIGSNLLTYVNVNLAESELATAVDVMWLEKIPGKNAELNVFSQPDTATVLVDDETKGMTPTVIPDLSPGDHTLTITSQGFIPRNVKIRLTAGYRLVSSVKLALSPNQTASPSPTPTDVLSSPTPATASRSGSVKPSPKASVSPAAGDPARPFIVVKDNDLHFLRVREAPSKTATEVAQLKPGDKRTILKSESGWYQVKYDGTNAGWVSGSTAYVDKVE